nr:hypothetical protein [Granulicella pectinivorans]
MQSAGHGCERDTALALVEVKRPHAKRIANQMHTAEMGIPKSNGEDPGETVDRPEIPALNRLQKER